MCRVIVYWSFFSFFIILYPIYSESWAIGVDLNVTLTQAEYSANWSGNEIGSVAWASNALITAEKQLHTKLNNKNTLKLAFGQTYNQDQDTDEWIGPLKSTDLVDLETVFRSSLGAIVDPYVAGRLESQFYDDRDPDMGRFFNPAEFTESFGVMRVLYEKEKRFWAARTGAAFKQNVDRDALDTLVGIRETNVRTYAGVEFITEFAAPLVDERITISSRLSFFKALFSSESSETAGEEQAFWQQPDMNWENVLTANITEYVMVNLYLQLLYDKEVDPGLRFKQTLSLGLTLKID